MPIASSSTNAVEKVCAVLRSLASKPNLRLTELAKSADLNKVTTLRILNSLIEEGFVQRPNGHKTYRLGVEAIALGAAANETDGLKAVAKASLQRLSKVSQDTALLSLRSGKDLICIDRQQGEYPIHASYLRVGDRLPLGITSSGIAILSVLKPEEVSEILSHNEVAIAAQSKWSRARVEAEIEKARETGHVLQCNQVVDRIGGISVPLQVHSRFYTGALTISAISERIVDNRDMLVVALKKEARAIVKALTS